MKVELILLIALATGLLVADRMLRIQPALDAELAAATAAAKGTRCPNGAATEPFQSPVETLNVPCGVTFPTCPAGSICGNGFCVAEVLRPLKEKCPLPVV